MKRSPLVLLVVMAASACQDLVTTPEVVDLAVEPSYAKGGKNAQGNGDPPQPELAQLGMLLFGDEGLSANGNQSCRTCHDPAMGFAGGVGVVEEGSVVQGSVPGRFGNRKPPSAAYATVAPLFSLSGSKAEGGNFWDGRATGEILGSPSADQALGPFLNPMEQALPDPACVLFVVSESDYWDLFEAAWGEGSLDIAFPAGTDTHCADSDAGALALPPSERTKVEAQYHNVGLSIAEFEKTLNAVDSRFDRGELTVQEQEGEQLFGGKGKCQQCHENRGSPAFFTDFQFHNLGVPRNPDNPMFVAQPNWFDPGLGGFTGRTTHLGKFKTPTIRNAAVGEGQGRTYMHNGALVSLRQVVQFYNTRDVLPECEGPVLDHPEEWGPDGSGCWPAPEYPENLDSKNMGNLGLSSDEVEAVVAYMRAMTDQSLEPGG